MSAPLPTELAGVAATLEHIAADAKAAGHDAVAAEVSDVAAELVTVELWLAARERYASRPRGEWLFAPWARERARDLFASGLTVEAVVERLLEPARCRGLFDEELALTVGSEATAKRRAA